MCDWWYIVWRNLGSNRVANDILYKFNLVVKVFVLGGLLYIFKWWTLRDSNPGRCYPRRFSRPVHSTNSAKDPHCNRKYDYKTGGATQI